MSWDPKAPTLVGVDWPHPPGFSFPRLHALWDDGHAPPRHSDVVLPPLVLEAPVVVLEALQAIVVGNFTWHENVYHRELGPAGEPRVCDVADVTWWVDQ